MKSGSITNFKIVIEISKYLMINANESYNVKPQGTQKNENQNQKIP